IAAPTEGGGGCELKRIKMPQLGMRQLDSAGKACKVDIALPVCKGYCKTSEEGTHRFPHSRHNSSVCAPKVEKMERIKLTNCEEGFDSAYAWIEIPMV
ncbi:hypothetical protein PFISCL1PPCAC_131, partial [Pristionchus fissidentatus]